MTAVSKAFRITPFAAAALVALIFISAVPMGGSALEIEESEPASVTLSGMHLRVTGEYLVTSNLPSDVRGVSITADIRYEGTNVRLYSTDGLTINAGSEFTFRIDTEILVLSALAVADDVLSGKISSIPIKISMHGRYIMGLAECGSLISLSIPMTEDGKALSCSAVSTEDTETLSFGNLGKHFVRDSSYAVTGSGSILRISVAVTDEEGVTVTFAGSGTETDPLKILGGMISDTYGEKITNTDTGETREIGQGEMEALYFVMDFFGDGE